jgi:thiol-disulfide isomerase/thioredoxin
MARRSLIGRGVSVVLVLGAVASLAVVPAYAAPGNDPVGARRAGPVSVGQPPPPLALDRIRGTEEVTLSGLAGRVVVLDFWATWCGPCRAVMPALDALYQRHRARGLSVVGLSPENDATIRSHISALPVTYTVARDVGGTTMQRYGVRAIPTIVVVDRGGQVREIMIGVDTSSIARLEVLVAQLLGQPAQPAP